MFPLTDLYFYNASSGRHDSYIEPDLLHQLTSSLETALVHTKAVVAVRNSLVCAILFAICVVLLLHLSPRSLVRIPERVAQARKILQALLTIITPTQSVWPRQYVNLVYRAAATRDFPVQIPLETLYEDVLKQRIELRNPKAHLPRLLRGVARAGSDPSLSFVLSAGPRWQSDMDKCRKRSFVRGPVTSTTSTFTGPQQAATVLGPGSSPCCSLFLHIFHQDMPSASLDCVPPEQLCAHLEGLKATLAPGSFLMLGLTTLASTASQQQARLAALPFLPRKTQLPRTSGTGTRASRTGPAQRSTTPLQTSITQVIDMLKAGRVPVAVEVVQNVSREYTEFMHEYVDGLEQDAEVRAQFVREWGMEAWVEERFCTHWEAALVEVGLLEAWTIVVRKPQ